MATFRPPRDNIVRTTPALEYRAGDDGGLGTLSGHFAVFNEWTRIDSAYEGTFMERIAPGAFKKAFTEGRDNIKVTLNHGKDPQAGDKPLGPIRTLEEDATGARYEVPLLDTSYNRDIAPGLKAGLYGASFRFRVDKDARVDRPGRSRDNPDGIPERTIQEAQVFEFGPVTYPAYAGATAGIRSMTDSYLRSLVAEPLSDGAEPAHSVPEPEPEPIPAPPPVERITPVDYTSYEDKVSRVAELKEGLIRQAGETTGVMSVEAQARWDADTSEVKSLKADITAMDTVRTQVRALEADEVSVERPDPIGTGVRVQPNKTHDPFSFEERGQFRSVEERAQAWRDDAMRIVDSYTFPDSVDKDKSRDRISNLLEYHDSADKELARRIKATGSPLYRRAFEKIIKNHGATYSLTPEEQRGTALAVGVDATGGFTVPFAFDPTIIAIGSWSGAVNPYRRAARVVDIVGTDTWNAITSTAVVATRTTESAAAVEQGPTFAQPQYIVTRVQGQITASFEMFQDRADLASEMSTLIAEAKDNEEEASMSVGATAAANIGVGPVSGTSGSYTALNTASGAVIVEGDLTATEAALPVRHRFNAQWFGNRINIRKAQSLETTGGKLFGGSQYPSVGNFALEGTGNTGLRLLGYPVNESPSLPSATTTTITCLVLANVASYVIVDRIGLTVQFIPFIFNSSALATGQQALYFMYRNTAKPINVDAGRVLRFL